MGYVNWSYEELNRFFVRMFFESFGFTKEESGIITDVLLTADLYGFESHGMQRMVRYHKELKKEPFIQKNSRKLCLRHLYQL